MNASISYFFNPMCIQISILSVDEFEPKISRQTYSFAFPSNAEKGRIIGRVAATDADGGEDGVVVFAIRTEQVGLVLVSVVCVELCLHCVDYVMCYGGTVVLTLLRLKYDGLVIVDCVFVVWFEVRGDNF